MRGHSAVVRKLHEVHTAIVLLTRAMTGNHKIPMPAQPVYPAERIEQRRIDADFDDLMGDIFGAMNQN